MKQKQKKKVTFIETYRLSTQEKRRFQPFKFVVLNKISEIEILFKI